MNPKRVLPQSSGLRQFRFGILFTGLLVLLVHEPLARVLLPAIHPTTARLLFGVAFGWLTISAVYAVSDSRNSCGIAILLGVPALVVECVDLSFLPRGSAQAAHLLSIAFLSYVICVLLRHIFSRDRVITDTVFAALCVYLLLGLLWAFVYALLEFVEQGSFSYAVTTGESMRFGVAQTSLSIYFSFMTMTTVGYGDVLPVSSAARALATLQAITGQFYLTVLVAWLVGLHIAHSRFGKDHTGQG